MTQIHPYAWKRRTLAVSTEQTSADNPLAGFGPNEWIVEEMYQRYLADPESVDPAWHDFFADYKPTIETAKKRYQCALIKPIDSSPSPEMVKPTQVRVFMRLSFSFTNRPVM